MQQTANNQIISEQEN